MKKATIFFALFASVNSFAQKVGIGTVQFTPTNLLDVRGNMSIGSGYAGIATASPTNGLIVEGNVGIGTHTTGQKLHVTAGNISIDNTYSVLFAGSSDGNWKIYRNSTADFTKSLVTGASLNINAFNAAGEGFAIGRNGGNSYYEILGSGPTHYFRGNVGIDVTTPQNKLDVEGAAVIGATYSGTNAGPANGLLVQGNVGMGTTTASDILHVYTTTSATGIRIDGTNAPRLSFANSGTTRFVEGLATAGGQYSTDAATNDMVFRVESTSQKMLFNTNGGAGVSTMALINGNVGIGTSAPGTKLTISDNATSVAPVNSNCLLHIIGSNASNGYIGLDNFGGGGLFRARLAMGTAASPTSVTSSSHMAVLAGRGYLGTGYSAGDLGVVAIAAEENFTNTSAKTGIAFWVTPSGSVTYGEKMRLNGDGNLGIGTVSPAAKLQISDNATSVAPIAGTGIHMIGTNGGFSTTMLIDGIGNSAWYRGRLALGTAASPSTLGPGSFMCTLAGRGYLGTLGYSNDLGRVAICAEETFTNTSGKTGIRFETTPSGAVACATGSSYLQFSGDGYLGIGHISPITRLDLRGSSATVSSTAQILGVAGDGVSVTTGLLLGQNASGGVIRAVGGSEVLQFYTGGTVNTAAGGGGTERMRIDNNGNMGIGITSTVAKLHVSGGGAHIYAGYNITQTARFNTNANGSIILDSDGGHASGWIRGIGWSYGAEDFTITRYKIDQSAGPINDFYISSAGNVQIGGGTPGSKFDVGANGDGTVARANAWNTFSDARWKKDVTPITNGLDLVKSLQGVNYTWKANDKKDFGFIAQEVEKVLPLAVHTDDKGYKSVDYARITSVLVEAVKEQQKKINSQQSTIESQQKTIDELKSTNQNLKAENTQQENRLQKIEQQLSEIKGNTIHSKK